MKLFMLLVIPISLVYILTANTAAKNEVPYSALFAGLLIGVLYSFVECMFTSSYYLIRYAFFPNYGFYLFFEAVLPMLFCTFFFVVFFKSRPRFFASLYFTLAAFYSVYMPARMIHRNAVFDWYLLFIKPLIYTCMLLGVRQTVLLLSDRIGETALMPKCKCSVFLFLVYSVPLVVLVLVPPAIDVMHLLALPVWLIISLSTLYTLCSSFGITVFAKKIQNR